MSLSGLPGGDQLFSIPLVSALSANGARTQQSTEKVHARKQTSKSKTWCQKTHKPSATNESKIGEIPNKGGKHVTKSFGPKPSRSPISPGMTRGSARNR